jgi:hypothetical protein
LPKEVALRRSKRLKQPPLHPGNVYGDHSDPVAVEQQQDKEEGTCYDLKGKLRLQQKAKT